MNPEDEVQIDILRWIHRHAPQCLVFHPPNGGGRSIREAVRLQKLGVLAGVADLIIVPPGGIIHALEIKRAKGGRFSDAQIAFVGNINSRGGRAAIVHSIEETAHWFGQWGIETI